AADEGVDTQADGEGSRPSMDLFKAIFAGSSDEKSSSSEEEQEDSEDSQEHTEEASFNTSQEAAAGETSVTQ
ncbi:G patch domain-containing protein 1, partial [Cricetulus griseus]